jgi:hypothetical protein
MDKNDFFCQSQDLMLNAIMSFLELSTEHLAISQLIESQKSSKLSFKQSFRRSGEQIVAVLERKLCDILEHEWKRILLIY